MSSEYVFAKVGPRTGFKPSWGQVFEMLGWYVGINRFPPHLKLIQSEVYNLIVGTVACSGVRPWPNLFGQIDKFWPWEKIGNMIWPPFGTHYSGQINFPPLRNPQYGNGYAHLWLIVRCIMTAGSRLTGHHVAYNYFVSPIYIQRSKWPVES